jgi:hypothetical protein
MVLFLHLAGVGDEKLKTTRIQSSNDIQHEK